VHREQATIVEAAQRAELRAALAERKAEEAEVAERRQLEADRRAAEAEAKRKARLKQQSEAKKAAKQEKKAKKHAPSAFALQEAQERQVAAERQSQDQRAAELASEYEATERQQQALRAADGAHAERRESRSTAGGSSDLSATDLAAMDGLPLAERSAERPELAPELTPSAIIDRVIEICACTREQASQAVARVGPLRWAGPSLEAAVEICLSSMAQAASSAQEVPMDRRERTRSSEE